MLAGVATKAANITVMAVDTTETTAAATTTAATRTEIEASCGADRIVRDQSGQTS